MKRKGIVRVQSVLGASADDSCRGDEGPCASATHHVARDKSDCASETKSCGETESLQACTHGVREVFLHAQAMGLQSVPSMICTVTNKINIVDVHCCFLVHVQLSVGSDNFCKSSGCTKSVQFR